MLFLFSTESDNVLFLIEMFMGLLHNDVFFTIIGLNLFDDGAGLS